MTKWQNEEQAREQIKALVAEYYHEFKEKKESFESMILELTKETGTKKEKDMSGLKNILNNLHSNMFLLKLKMQSAKYDIKRGFTFQYVST